MFVRLNDEWYLNLARVHEARFERRGSVLTGHVISLELVDEFGGGEPVERLTNWTIDGEEAENLRAALRHYSAPQPHKGVVV